MQAFYRLAAALVLPLLLSACGGGGGGDSTGPSTPVTPAAPTFNHFPMAVGDRWSYSVAGAASAQVRVLAATTLDGRKVFQVRTLDADGSHDDYIEKTDSAVTQLPGPDADALTRALGPVILMRLPVRAGDRYTAVDRTLSGVVDLDGDGKPDTLVVRAETNVVAIAALATTTGTLADTAHLRTVFTQTASLSASGQQVVVTTTSDDWYAPDIGQVKNTLVTVATGTNESSEQSIEQFRVGTQRSDTVAPTVTSVSPTADGVSQTALIKLSFSEDMDTLVPGDLGLSLTNAAGQPVAGRRVWDDKRTLRFEPTQALATGNYRVSLSGGAEDLGGNTVAAPRSWNFRLDKDGPVLVGVAPADGGVEVALDSVITVTFDEPVDASTAAQSIVLFDPLAVYGTVATSATVNGAAVSLRPLAPLLPRHTYNVLVNRNLRDLIGNISSAESSTSFRTDPGRFAEAVPLQTLINDSNASGFVSADFNGDGRLDLAFTTSDGKLGPDGKTAVRVLLQKADGSYAPPIDFIDATVVLHQLFAVDLDGDGRAELLSIGSNGLQQWRWNAAGAAEAQPMPAISNSFGLIATLGAVRIAADNQRLALFATDVITGERLLWRQTAPGVFAAGVALPASNSQYQRLGAAGDLNGDGRDDVMFLGSEPGDSITLMQQADGSFTAVRKFDELRQSQFIRLGDFNRDGRLDVAATTDDGSGNLSISLFMQQADGSFTPGALLPINCISCGFNDLALADLDGNGRLDLVVHNSSTVSFLMQLSDGRFAPADRYNLSAPFGKLLVADVTGDGRLDVIAGKDLLRQRATSAKPSSTGLSLRRHSLRGPASGTGPR